MTSVASFVLLTLSSSLDDLSQYSQTHHVATDREIIPSSGLTSWIFHLTSRKIYTPSLPHQEPPFQKVLCSQHLPFHSCAVLPLCLCVSSGHHHCTPGPSSLHPWSFLVQLCFIPHQETRMIFLECINANVNLWGIYCIC